MKLLFVESEGFTEFLTDYFASDDDYRAFQSFMMTHPEAGKIIPDGGGLRKVRWLDPKRGKGKRSGIRIVYLYVPEFERLLLLEAYGKDERVDLTAAQRRALAKLASAYRDALRNRAKKGSRS